MIRKHFYIALFLVGCASQPEDIKAVYVSPNQYQAYDCAQLSAEQERVSRGVSELYSSLKDEATADAWQAGGGLILWPALFWLEGGDGPEAQEYARLKGEKQTIERLSIQRRCGLAAVVPAAGPAPTVATASDFSGFWRLAATSPKYDPNVFRKGACGNWIQYDQYGTQGEYGWIVDKQRPLWWRNQGRC